jgi:hypothetical protein
VALTADRLDAALAAIPRGELDEFDLARIEAMVTGYTCMWDDVPCEVLGVEHEFQFPLVDHWLLGGKIDLVLRLADGRLAIVDHKCIAGDARILNHATGKYERADDLCTRGDAPLVSAMRSDGSIVVVQAKPLRRAGMRPIYRVRTLSGRSVRVSGNHPMYTQRGWVTADAVTSEDWLAVPRRLTSPRTDAPFSDEAIRLIGYMIGDGCTARMQFTKTDETVLADVVRCAAVVGETVSVSYPQKPKAPYVSFSQARGGVERRSGKLGCVGALLDTASLRDARSANKRLPLHLGLSDRQLGQLLGALWSTDGCIDARACGSVRIIYTSVSAGLCEDIQHALQRLGIVSYVRHNTVMYRGERRPVSTVQIVSRASRRRFLSLAIDGVIPVLRSAIPLNSAIELIPTSAQGDDSRLQPSENEHVWWDRVTSVDLEASEETYDVEVPEYHSFVVDGFVTHNTSGEDVSAGSTYRERLILNGQVTQYMWGAETLGWEADVFIFDVLSKPLHRPYGVTKSRHVAETPQEYRSRILEAMKLEPGAYFARIEITRNEAERGEYVRRIHDDAALMDHVRNATLNTPNEHGCFVGKSPCEFWPVCSGVASVDDPTLYQVTKRHRELEQAVDIDAQLMTNSRRASFNRCRRLHHYRYDLGLSARAQSKHLIFGNAIHVALERYWLSRKNDSQSTAAE